MRAVCSIACSSSIAGRWRAGVKTRIMDAVEATNGIRMRVDCSTGRRSSTFTTLAPAIPALVVMVHVTGCNREEVPSATESDRIEIPFVVNAGIKERGRESLRFFVDDQLVYERLATPRSDAAEEREDVKIRFSSRSEMPNLLAKALLPCGWRDVQLEVLQRYPATRGVGGKFDAPAIVVLRTSLDFRLDTFVVDNRERPEATLHVGHLQSNVPANRGAFVSVYAPDCDVELKLENRVIGTIPARPQQMSHRYYFVDPPGNRCYEYKEVHYGKLDAGTKVNPPAQLRRQILHLLPGSPDFLFKDASDSIQVGKYVQRARQGQLLDRPC